MIYAQRISIEEFRGIRRLSINFHGKNFAVCGPNGTGKSGVVDAIEFALTGNISRISGRGAGDLSVKNHAPHVDSRNRPDKARVTLVVEIPALKQTVTIGRCVSDPSNPVITPKTSEIEAALREIALHPEFVLSRRELIRYVLSTPGDRAKEVQALLRLDSVEDLRLILQRIANGLQKETTPLKREKEKARELLLQALEIADFTGEAVLRAANGKRALLGLPALPALTSATSLKDGLAAGEAARRNKISKAQVTADSTSVREIMVNVASEEATTLRTAIHRDLVLLANDPIARLGVEREQFLQTAISLIDTDACPVCDTGWDPEQLKRHVQEKISQLREAARRREAIEQRLKPLVAVADDLRRALEPIERHALVLIPPVSPAPITAYRERLRDISTRLRSVLPFADCIAALESVGEFSNDFVVALGDIEARVAALPEPPEQEAARDFLIVGQERLENYKAIAIRVRQAEERAATAKKVCDTYVTVSNRVLEGVYKHVEKEFSDLYRAINNDDESQFSAQLVPSMGKLGFGVDFYGRGYFPPGAYHSEGHQDGMGLCVYLALMRHLRGDKFTLAVLDDVLMSVDVGHRRQVCRLLTQEFPHTQFILTTHDEIWLRHMKTAGLISGGNAIHFRKWDVGHGPTEWDDRDVWQEIEKHLDENDVRAAASLLRHYLEFIGAEYCHRLRASVEHRGDAQFQLDDVLPPAMARFGKLLERGITVAKGWNQPEVVAALEKRRNEFRQRVDASNIERWQINPAVHFNEWMNLQADEFRPVVAAYQRLVRSFVCSVPECSGTYYVVPGRGELEMLRCSCGASNINLAKKPN